MVHRNIDLFVRVVLWAVIAVIFPSNPAAAAPSAYDWPPTAASWSTADERGYEAFVQAIADSGCTTVRACLAAPANPLAKGDPPGLVFSADCADLVYMLRAYYAWKRGLPFGFVTIVEARQAMGEGDLRTTVHGNYPAFRWDVTSQTPGADIRTVLQTIRDQVSTATFRVDPRIERPVQQDFYSPAMTREALRPGSAIYNGDGHVVILSRIDDAGRIHFLDAHPDMSVTRGVYAGQFDRGDPGLGAGFHAWRPFQVVEGRFAFAVNDQLQTYSLEQYFGPNGARDWRDADFSEKGRNVDFVEFTRRRLVKGQLIYDLVPEFRFALGGLCDAFQERARMVDDSVARGYWRQPRPGRLEGSTPDEAYVWLAFSSPGRDRRLRNHAQRTADALTRQLALYAAKDPLVTYAGKDPRADLQRAFDEVTATCTAAYINSDRQRVLLTMRDMLIRLPALSFDPYHCPERRWGASGGELARCDEDGDKSRWYVAEAPLRTLIAPRLTPANPTLDELLLAAPNTWTPPDLETVIQTAPEKPHKRGKR
jgi:hypothetical protein